MALPVVASIGPLAASVDPISPTMPAGTLSDDALIFAVENRTGAPDVALSIANQAGGTWTQVGFSHAGNSNRLTVFLSRYNGTQTSPTTNDTGDHQEGRIIAVRGCDWSSGTALNAEGGNAPTFAETVSAITGITTSVDNCLILDIIAGEQPDLDGGAVFGNWTNGALASLTEVADASTSQGLGGSLAINSGTKATAGATGVTSVSHGNWRVAYKKLALAGIPGLTQHIDKNPRGQVTIDGTPRFLRAVYDAGLPTAGWPAFVGPSGRNLGRYHFDIILNVQSGTFGNGLELANALVPYGMFTLAVANFFGNFTFPPASFNPATFGFDFYGNGTFTTAPEGTGPFRDLWTQKSQRIAQYIADEPAWQAQPWSGNPSAQINDGRDDCVVLHQYCKSVVPTMPTMVTFLNDNVTQYQDWSPFNLADWLGSDIYTIGQAPELHPDNDDRFTSTYGYMNFSVGEAGAMARYYCNQYGRVPMIILQANKFGSSSRFPTTSEMSSHMVIALAELRGVGIIWWWALGVQSGALDERPFHVFSGNGTTTVFGVQDPGGNPVYVEEAIDVQVQVGGLLQAPSAYTVQNVGDATYVKVGNFFQLVNPPTVTMAVAPPSGTNNIVITVNKWPTAKRTATLNLLESMTLLLSQLEPIMLQPSNPALLTANSAEAADFLSWRIPYCNTLRNGGTDRPVWLFGAVARYQAEYDALQQVPPNFSYSNHIMDQKADIRTCCWESGGGVGIVASYNLNPNARTATLQWHLHITRVEVLLENRDVPINADGRSWTDTWGGASSLRQGPFNQGHLYRLTIGGSNPSAAGATLTGAAPTVSRSTVLKPGAFVRGG